jgi:CRP/FNR family cyclic AMP-dependent transcriptional regulator
VHNQSRIAKRVKKPRSEGEFTDPSCSSTGAVLPVRVFGLQLWNYRTAVRIDRFSATILHPLFRFFGELAVKSKQKRPFDAQAFLDSAGVARRVVKYGRGEAIFTQGDACGHVLYVQEGGVKLSVLSTEGREAVVAMLGPGEFFGEGCLAGQPVRMGSATATVASRILHINKDQMVNLLRKQHAMSDRFIAHMLARNIRVEEDLVDQLFNSSEKRLARALLLLARYGKHSQTARVVPTISQETLAEMVGTTRSRVNFFMKKFQRMGFIDYKDGLKVNNSLLTVVLHD